jgi:hypothetical protein
VRLWVRVHSESWLVRALTAACAVALRNAGLRSA